jgi:hypothetical protein
VATVECGPQPGPISPPTTLYSTDYQCIPPTLCIIHSKIRSINLLSQPHPPNTKNASSLILLHCIKKPRQRGSLWQFLVTFIQDLGFKASLERLWWSCSIVNNTSLNSNRTFQKDSWNCSKTSTPPVIKHLRCFDYCHSDHLRVRELAHTQRSTSTNLVRCSSPQVMQ